MIKILVLLFFLRLFLDAFLLSSYTVRTETAGHSLQTGDRVLASPLLYGPQIPFATRKRLPELIGPRRGDLVIYAPEKRKTLSWWQKVLEAPLRFVTGEQVEELPFTSPSVDARYGIGMIIAEPGDSLRMADGEFWILPKGETEWVQEQSPGEKPLLSRQLPPSWSYPFPFADTGAALVMGEGEFFIIHDAPSIIADSRLWGGVKREDIISKVLLRYWPEFSLF